MIQEEGIEERRSRLKALHDKYNVLVEEKDKETAFEIAGQTCKGRCK